MNRKPKLLLINPWITDFAAFDFWSKPLGLLYLAAVLREAGAEIQLLDCMDRLHPLLRAYRKTIQKNSKRYGTGKYLRELIPKPQVFRHIPRYYARYGLPLHLFHRYLAGTGKPDAILITSAMTYWYPGVQMAVREARSQYPDVPILLGGIYATLMPEHAKATSGADAVLSGEAEKGIVRVLKELLPGLELAEPVFSSLDDYPWPAWEHYENLSYAVIMTSRGCPLRCSFCASNLVSGKFRMHSVDRVVEEIVSVLRRTGVRDIAFYDDALLTNYNKHLVPIMQHLRKIGFNARFHTPNGLQCKFLTAELVREMFATGFRTMRLSLESISEDRQKKDMSKKVSRESFVRAAQNLHQAGFALPDLDAYILIALPGQSVLEVLESMAFVHCQSIGIRLAAFSPIPGTVDFKRAIAAGYLKGDFDPLLTNNSAVPVKAPNTNYQTYWKISIIARDLNTYLRTRGRPMASQKDLLLDLQSQFSHEELFSSVRNFSVENFSREVN